MHKLLATFFLCLCLPFLYAQEGNDTIPKPTEADSLKTTLRSNGVIMQDSLFEKKKVINPLAPSKAAFFRQFYPVWDRYIIKDTGKCQLCMPQLEEAFINIR